MRCEPTTTQFVNKRSTIQPPVWLTVWLNSWVFAYDLSGCGFESAYSHLFNGIFPPDLQPGMKNFCLFSENILVKKKFIFTLHHVH